ncbi:MAG: hypothetical protein EBY22_12285, partial [Gammaproteobacteria bacterium]|nr:hypothetical protein [Gammaproteobacteria bacterium]
MNSILKPSLQVSDGCQWRFLISLLMPVDFNRWITRRYITPLEFCFILFGCEPIPNEFLFKIVEELQIVLQNINRQTSFRSISDRAFIQSINKLCPHVKNEEEAKEKILEQAQGLLDCLEIINRGMLAMPEEYTSCFSLDQGTFKEKLWRFEFLIHWIKHESNIKIPHELIGLDEGFDLQKELNNESNKNSLRQVFGEDQIMNDGLI